jgi:hypothetical protein
LFDKFCAKFFEEGFRDSAARREDSEGFQSGSNLADIANFGWGEPSDDGSAVRFHMEDPHTGEGTDGFADRSLADTEFFRESVRNKSIAGKVGTIKDPFEDPFDDPRAVGRRLVL